MPTKTSSYGTMLMPNPGIKVQHWSKAGSLLNTYTRTPASAVARRKGRASTLTGSVGDDGRFRPVDHVQSLYSTHGMPQNSMDVWWKYTPSYNNTGYGFAAGVCEHTYNTRYQGFLDYVSTHALSSISIDWNALASQSLSAMLPSFGAGNSLVNFLVELKDFRSTAKRLWSRLGASADSRESILDILLGLKSEKGKPSKTKTLRDLSQSHLSLQFGWIPFFKDIQSLVTSMSKFQKTYQGYIDRANKPQSRYYGTWVAGTEEGGFATTGTQSIPSSYDYSLAGFTPQCRYVYRRNPHSGVRYHATLRYRYPMPEGLNTAAGRNKALLDAIGFNGNPAILWNIIPWSFAIDWLVNVGRYLDKLKVENVQFQTEILDFCHSARYERSFQFYLAPHFYQQLPGSQFVTGSEGARQLMDTCTRTVYKRLVGLPNLRSAISTSGLSLREFTLAGALAGVRFRRRRRR